MFTIKKNKLTPFFIFTSSNQLLRTHLYSYKTNLDFFTFINSKIKAINKT